MTNFADADPGPQTQQHRDPADGRWYAPNRDFAYVGPALITQALRGFNLPVSESSPYIQLLSMLPREQYEKELQDYAKTLALLVMRSTKESRKVAEIAQELIDTNDPGMAASWQVKTAVLARLGEMCIGCTFAGIQDITPEGGQPPHYRSIESLVRVAEQLANLAK